MGKKRLWKATGYIGLVLTGVLSFSCESCNGQTAEVTSTNNSQTEVNNTINEETESLPITDKDRQNGYFINKDGNTIGTRFVNLDADYTRQECDAYGQWLLNLKLKPDGSSVHFYDGIAKEHPKQPTHDAVIDMDLIGNFTKQGVEKKADLQQCADACMRLWGEYLWQNKIYDKIHFKGSNGFVYSYSKWAEGYRVHFIKGGKEVWSKDAGQDYSYKTFRQFMSLVFNYCGTLSLSKELEYVNPEDVKPGDILIYGGSPGHAVTVMDVLHKKGSNAIKVIFSQSYMPAQEIEILSNWEDKRSPWFTIDMDKSAYVNTPQWEFVIGVNNFMRWSDR